MITRQLLASLALGFMVWQAQACDTDSPPKKIGDLEAKFGARRVLKALVSRKAVDAGWEGSEPMEVNAIESTGQVTWKITFKRENASAENMTLYILLNDVGKYLGANYDGVIRVEDLNRDQHRSTPVVLPR